jgi:hypothetical protein
VVRSGVATTRSNATAPRAAKLAKPENRAKRTKPEKRAKRANAARSDSSTTG